MEKKLDINENEVWLPIKDYENYMVSNLGRIKSLEKIVKRKRNGDFKTKDKILKIQTNRYGYSYVTLYKNKKPKIFSIHQLVSINFIPNPNNYKYVNHKDENKSNNCVDNLEWCDVKYNNCYGSRRSRVKQKTAKKINQYDLEGNFVKTWDSLSDAIKFYKNIHIVDVCRGRRKKCMGYIWRYENE